MAHLNIEYLMELHRLLSIEIKIAKQQNDARAIAYFNLENLVARKNDCKEKLEEFIPEEFIYEITKTS